jgi:tRNA dimethylallyltransferase
VLAGRIDEETAREQTIVATRRFARRQESWFRRDPRVAWYAADSPGLIDEVIAGLGEPPTLGG